MLPIDISLMFTFVQVLGGTSGTTLACFFDRIFSILFSKAYLNNGLISSDYLGLGYEVF